MRENGKTVRVVIGELYGARSPVATTSETIFADVTLKAGSALPLDAGAEERAIYLIDGEIDIAGDRFGPGRLLVFKPGDAITIRAVSDAHLAIVGGATMDGPRHIWWNFVSSRKERIDAGQGGMGSRPFWQGAGRRDRVHPAAGQVTPGLPVRRKTGLTARSCVTAFAATAGLAPHGRSAEPTW